MKALRNKLKLSKPYKLLIPSLLTLYTLIGIGVFSAVLETVKHFDESVKLFSSSDFYTSLGLSLRLALGSTLIAVIIALLILFGLFILSISDRSAFSTLQRKLGLSQRQTSSKSSADTLNRLFQAPMLVPYIVAGYLVFLTFGQSGLLSRIGYGLGLVESISSFPILVNDASGLGITIAFVWKTAPFMILMLYPAMQSLDKKFLDMSRVFGLDPVRYYWQILVPHMAPTIAFSGFIVFAYTLTSFEIPFMLGSTYPKTLAVSAYQMYTGGTLEERHLAMTMSLVLFAISLVLGYLAFKHAAAQQKHLKEGEHI